MRSGRSLLLIVGIVFAVAAGWFTWRQVTSQGTAREGAPNWSPDGKRIVFYAERRGGPADLWVMDVDDRERQQLTSTPADEGGPTFSPNGRQIAFDTNRDGNFEIYVMDVDTRAARRLTQHKGRDVAPAWSRDGRRIAFMSDRQGRKEFDIYVMNADGTGVEALTKSESNWFPQYGPDGRSLAMHVWNDVHVFDLPTRTARRLTFEPQNGMYPTWSRYGEQIAFMTWRNGPPQIFTMNADGTNQEMLVTMSRGGAIDPRWSPDGTRIAFVHVPEASVHERPNAEQERLIYIVEIETRKLTRLSR